MLSRSTVPLHKKFLNPLVYDYLSRKESVKSFYGSFPDRNGFKNAISNASFSETNRLVLREELIRQAESVRNTTSLSRNNIDLLLNENTLTVTTGHQLCLFTGPLYFIYKIFSVINLCEKLKEEFPDKNFLPVYWLASEDHDLEEINHLYVFGKKLTWETSEQGAAGHISTKGLDKVYDAFRELMGDGEQALYLSALFKEAYLAHDNLKDATRYLVNELFGDYGLIILDGNSSELKKLFSSYFKKDFFESVPFKKVNSAISKLDALSYEPQVNPREVNSFYLGKNSRIRIETDGKSFRAGEATIAGSREELEKLLDSEPERISPNVVLRPCYQQLILPNIAYVGGPGELAYWLEYKEMFDAFGLTFPVLVPRQSVMIIDKTTGQRIEKLNFTPEDFFADEVDLIKAFMEKSNRVASLEPHKDSFRKMFEALSAEAVSIDPTLKGTVDAESQKALNSLNLIEQKMNRALKQRSDTELNQLKTVKSKLFPGNIPQERIDNFSMYYQKWGQEFMGFLKENLVYDLESFKITFLVEK
jgi:bacillithiol biosynthesis cysteine-adding enzyme BshC